MSVPARPIPLFTDIEDVATRLAETGYLPDRATATAVFLADRLDKPLLGAGGLRDGAGQRGLAGAGGSLDEQRLVQPVGEKDGGGRGPVGQVSGLGEPRGDILDVGEQRYRAGGNAHQRSTLFAQ